METRSTTTIESAVRGMHASSLRAILAEANRDGDWKLALAIRKELVRRGV